MKKWLCGLSLLLSTGLLFAKQPGAWVNYCEDAGGKVEYMTAQLMTQHGLINGQKKQFCNFYIDKAFVSIGLETFSSKHPSIAATYIKSLPEISESSPLFSGNYPNPSTNVCKNLGGSSITMLINGGFSNQLGQEDVCVFGDGSMVSGWSLIYMANGRDGYNSIKQAVHATPLEINIPG
jgi:hypothetical protein